MQDGWNSVSWGNGTQPQAPDAAEEEARQKRTARLQRLALADSCIKAPDVPKPRLKRLRKGGGSRDVKPGHAARPRPQQAADAESSDDESDAESGDDSADEPRPRAKHARSAFVDDEAQLSGSGEEGSGDDEEGPDEFEADFIDPASQPVGSQMPIKHGDMLALYHRSLLHQTPVVPRHRAVHHAAITPGSARTPSTYDLEDSFIDSDEGRAFATQSTLQQAVTSTLESFGDMFESWGPQDVGDQSGKTFVITGANAGLGYEVAKELAKKGGHVVMATRSQERAQQAIDQIKAEVGDQASVDFLRLDLTDFSSIKAAAAELKGKRIDVLANNASVAAPKDDLGKHNKEGFEVTMATNHFGPFLFTHLLLDDLKASKPSRIVYHGASGESMAKVDWDDLKGEKHTDSTLAGEYAQTKLFNIMTAFELDHRFSSQGIDGIACQPGVSHSSIYEKADTSKADVKAIDINQKVAGQSQERGSIPLLYSCTSPELQGNGGKYIGPKYFKGPINLNIGQTKDRTPTNKEAQSPEQRKRLYDETMRIMQPWLGGN
ncbi:hypothetical protein WJX73_001218 [Symbiochloris irregularis]|uniref:Protochlorophyllide reductase n=1 Tax=Symbiochloris irregularis TaxID=706552 RepID=A0AAW1NWC1_9CHLO